MSPLEWRISEVDKREIAKNPPKKATIHVQILQGYKS
jgi:23S rRNA (guanine745-N1)-methyltransferase